ncbi:Hypothetical protein FKW44_016872 [Caligus rogercresseyi]|uniref:Uncharacterized protein n=1 Tax=Caligus rogercresseyi TaxID=217165 RepID=A0A7T8H348_CALRO|nr:Hypothetical protein FKW44_016872 [Caligus rogercresseyi]
MCNCGSIFPVGLELTRDHEAPKVPIKHRFGHDQRGEENFCMSQHTQIDQKGTPAHGCPQEVSQNLRIAPGGLF